MKLYELIESMYNTFGNIECELGITTRDTASKCRLSGVSGTLSSVPAFLGGSGVLECKLIWNELEQKLEITI